MIDVNVLVISARWLFLRKGFKIVFQIALFYFFRAVLQSVFYIRYPTDYIWSHPGVYSLAVPYAPANDFFYSGHVGLCTICYLHFSRDDLGFMKRFAMASICVESFTLLVTRAHYSIDLFTGVIVAHYVFLVVEWVYEQRYKDKKQTKTIDQTMEIASNKDRQNEKIFINSRKQKKGKGAVKPGRQY